jgi:hypothetical protein
MAVRLKDDGRYPASQQIPVEQFAKFAADCQNAPKPSDKFKQIMIREAMRRKAACL